MLTVASKKVGWFPKLILHDQADIWSNVIQYIQWSPQIERGSSSPV